jgi:hypothetical protein
MTFNDREGRWQPRCVIGQRTSAVGAVGGVLRNRPGDTPYSRRKAAEKANSVE